MNPRARARSRSTPHHLTLLLLTSATLALGGCFSMRSAATERTAPAAAAPADAWPDRNPAIADQLASLTPRTIHWYDLPPGPNGAAGPNRLEAEVTDIRPAPSGGLIRLYREPPDEPTDSDELDELSAKFAAMLGNFEPNGAYISSYTYECNSFRDWLESELAFRKLMAPLPGTAPDGATRSTLSAEIALTSGVPFQLPDAPVPATQRRGLILHFSALISNQYEKQFLDKLRARGWTVIDFDTWSGLQAPRDPAALATLPELERRRQHLLNQLSSTNIGRKPTPEHESLMAEVTEVDRQIRTIRRGWFTACSPTDADAAGRDIAAAVDNTLAENAYAAEAVLDDITQRRPDIPTSPAVIIGFSAGAITAPAVAARLGDRINALILVGGGADVLQISRTTNLKGQTIGIRCGDQPADDGTFAAVNAAYRQHTRLDPFALGPSLAHTPILMIHAREDQTVPAATGELLYDRLAKPDRLDFSMDHYKLFYFIPDQANRVGDWLDEHAPRAR